MKFLLICLAGALGTGARYILSDWARNLFGTAFPFGTLIINTAGCFLIGAVMQVGLNSDIIPPTMRVVITMGILGGFTTYSSFNYETLAYLQDGEMFKGILNFVIMSTTCLIAGMAGIAVAKGAL